MGKLKDAMKDDPELQSLISSLREKKKGNISHKKIRKAELSPKAVVLSYDGLKNSEYILRWVIECNLCSSVKEFVELVRYKEWKESFRGFKNGTARVKVNSCSKCSEFLKKLSKDELIKVVLDRKKVELTPLPKIDWVDVEVEEEAVPYLKSLREHLPMVLKEYLPMVILAKGGD